jgi:hypothetical protein
MKTFQFEIAGTKFRMAAYKQAQVTRGDRLTLVPEPGNQYDPKAIKVMKGDLHIGYVPKTHNKQIHEDVTQRPAELGCCVDAAWASGAWVVVNIKDDSDGKRDEGIGTVREAETE